MAATAVQSQIIVEKVPPSFVGIQFKTHPGASFQII